MAMVKALNRMTLLDIGEIKSAGVDKKIVEGEIPVRLLNFTDVFKKTFIFSNDINHWVTAPYAKVDGCSVLKGDVFFTPSSETRDEVGMSAVIATDIDSCCYSYHIVRFRIKEVWDLNFKAFAFSTPSFRRQVSLLADGSGQRKKTPPPKTRKKSPDAATANRDDDRVRVECRFEAETLWLSQATMAELYAKDVRTINEHLVNIFAEGELAQTSTIRKFRISSALGLTSFKGGEVRKGDVTVGKNYLNQDEINELNLVVNMWLDFAEDQARRRQQIFLRDWQEKLDQFLQLNDRNLLQAASFKRG
ncbi:Cell filamentation protein Fic [Aphis craccivora]|uniref:Cell filamentation protein Fic n=1 Tax=Aphis craccivora TaxID=307492 RepID=A0A6G0XIU4_APHCR|nr:Cell filamentation protein Fic [Aphis craccivora]